MKKIKVFTLSIFALATLGFASCKKDYTCTCTSSVGSTSTTHTHALPDQTRKDAKDACENYEEKTTGGIVITSCTL